MTVRSKRIKPSHADDRVHCLTIDEAADLLHVSRSTILRELAKGKLQWTRVSASRRIPMASILAYLEANASERQGARRRTASMSSPIKKCTGRKPRGCDADTLRITAGDMPAVERIMAEVASRPASTPEPKK